MVRARFVATKAKGRLAWTGTPDSGVRAAGPAVASPKVRIGFRLSPQLVRGIRATGRGYNARVERVPRGAGRGEAVGECGR
jgi:uncharacterized protein (DUF4415 family)